MERESFENETVAAEMNRRFINIKVDREERPDVDQLYMTAVQLMTQHGGWPMSVFLTPDLRPFYGGTYFPPDNHGNRPGFVTLLRALDDAWQNRRDQVEKSTQEITDLLGQLAEPPAPSADITIDQAMVDRLIARSVSDYDPRAGGYGSAPKFPRQTLLELLLVTNPLSPNAGQSAQIFHTLDCMAHGGIRDQLGGAFHRYSTDADWLVPHFEIMLYDNAMLGWCYIEAYRQTEDRRYSTVARGIFDFVLRSMTSPDGAFYTAFDAEVDTEEGQTYLWTRSEVEAVLAEGLADDPAAERKIHRFCRVYGLDDGPNFVDPHHGNGIPEKNILFLAEPEGEKMPALLDPELAVLREILLTHRNTRKQPGLDTKIITSWNALMIRALAVGGYVLQEKKYLDAAVAATEFLLKNHRGPDEGLLRSSRDGTAKTAGFLDDYAFLIQAMLALADAGASERWKDSASALAAVMIRKFGDPVRGGFFFNEESPAGTTSDLIVRQKIATDSPLPSGNGVAAMVLLAMGQSDWAGKTIRVFARQLQRQAEGMSALLQAAAAYLRENDPIFAPAGGVKPTGVRSPQEISLDAVTLTPKWKSDTVLDVGVSIKPGLHISAHDTTSGMKASQLAISAEQNSDEAGGSRNNPKVARIDYPPSAELTVAFSDTAVHAYSGELVIAVVFAEPPLPGSKIIVSLQYQACDESSCLPVVSKIAEVQTR